MARRRSATEAERALWGSVVRDVRPLRAAEPAVPPTEPPVAALAPPASDPPRSPIRSPGKVDRATLVDRATPIDRATMERLRRGQIAIEARIDLHGLDQRQAFAALTGFVDASARLGRRAVLVITGKGPSAEGGGVLRRNAPHWLLASPLSSRILTMAPAHLRHGGDGAFYVLLRRKPQ